MIRDIVDAEIEQMMRDLDHAGITATPGPWRLLSDGTVVGSDGRTVTGPGVAPSPEDTRLIVRMHGAVQILIGMVEDCMLENERLDDEIARLEGDR